jgi:hypothetical protein
LAAYGKGSEPRDQADEERTSPHCVEASGESGGRALTAAAADDEVDASAPCSSQACSWALRDDESSRPRRASTSDSSDAAACTRDRTPRGRETPADDLRHLAPRLRGAWRRRRQGGGAHRERAVHRGRVRVADERVDAVGEDDRPGLRAGGLDARRPVDAGPPQVEVVERRKVAHRDLVDACHEVCHRLPVHRQRDVGAVIGADRRNESTGRRRRWRRRWWRRRRRRWRWRTGADVDRSRHQRMRRAVVRVAPDGRERERVRPARSDEP